MPLWTIFLLLALVALYILAFRFPISWVEWSTWREESRNDRSPRR
jgi:hypothetical protein